MDSIVNNTAPEYLTSHFVRRCDLTSYNLREKEYKLAVPQPCTQFYKRSLSYSESVLWNSLPLEVRQLTSPKWFKEKLGDMNFDWQIIWRYKILIGSCTLFLCSYIYTIYHLALWINDETVVIKKKATIPPSPPFQSATKLFKVGTISHS